MMEWANILSFFKLKLSVIVGITIALGVFLFASDKFASQLGIEKLRADYRSYAGCAFILCAALCATQLGARGVSFFFVGHRHRKLRKLGIKRLHNLSPAEKQILCGYIFGKTKAQYFSIQDGNVRGLENAKIIHRSSEIGNLFGRGFSFNINEWAWEYLNENPNLIADGVPRDASGRIIPYGNPRNLLGLDL